MARRVKSGEQRLRAFLNICGSKRVDEESGGLQPAYRVDGITIRAEFPKPKGDDDLDLGDNIERKQASPLGTVTCLKGAVHEPLWSEQWQGCLHVTLGDPEIGEWQP